MMRICGRLEGPKSGNVEIPLVFACFLRSTDGAKRDRDFPGDDRDLPGEWSWGVTLHTFGLF